MNKKILTVVCVVMMTMVFSGCNLPGKDKSQEAIKEGVTAEQSQKDDSGDKDGSYFETMKDLMARGKTMKCTYTQEVEGGGTATGVVYIADKNARTEIAISEETGHAGKMYAIVDQKWTYSWVEGSSQGYKMTLEASDPGEKNEETIADMSKEIKFECKSWKKDNSKFKVPANIEFQDMTETMGDFKDMDLEKELDSAEVQGNEMLCEICKNAPDPAECLGDVVCD